MSAPAWMRPFCRAHRAIDASIRLIDETLRTVARSERCAHRRPVRASRNLHDAATRLQEATSRLVQAARELAKTHECLAREPESSPVVADLVAWAAERFAEVTVSLDDAADDVFRLQDGVLVGLETGVLVPEATGDRRPRIRLTPRPAPMRAFLLLRQPRVADRIAPILRRRRWTPRPAAVRVPRRGLLGRAPPLSLSLH